MWPGHSSSKFSGVRLKCLLRILSRNLFGGISKEGDRVLATLKLSLWVSLDISVAVRCSVGGWITMCWGGLNSMSLDHDEVSSAMLLFLDMLRRRSFTLRRKLSRSINRGLLG